MLELITSSYEDIIDKLDFSLLKNKMVLVTGSTGLIGLHILSVLKQLNKHNYNIEIHTTINSDIDQNLYGLFEKCKIFQGDLTTDQFFTSINLNNNYDYIFHAAGYGQPNKFNNEKLTTLKLNTQSLFKLFDMLKNDGKLLYCSTSEIYNGLEKENIEEYEIGNTTTIHPRACYIEAKRCGEAICLSQPIKKSSIARISLAYGPGTKKDDARVMNNLIHKGLCQNKIMLLDSGRSIRTYIYISDAIEMIFNILLHGKEPIYNIGGVSKLSILDLAKKIGSILNRSVEITEDSHGILGNPKIVNISLKKYLTEFKKTNFVSIEDGLEKTIQWNKELYYA